MPHLALFSDFDGTLIELAETPDAIQIPRDLAGQIEFVRRSFGGAFAIISGRSLSDLDRYLPDTVAAAGGHGTERRLADGRVIEAAGAARESVERIAEALRGFADGDERLLVEEKPAAVAFHYRLAPERALECRAAMTEAIAALAPDFVLLEGKMVVEARPAGTSKADAILSFMQEPPFAGRTPVFFGDDTTDEDGFVAAQNLGGVGVKIGVGETVAHIRAADVDSARAIILRLARRAAEATVDVQ